MLWWGKHRLTVAGLSLVFLLSGCGFNRVHQSSSSVGQRQAFTIKVSGLQGYPAYRLKRELETQLASLPRLYDQPLVVKVKITTEQGELTFGKDATVLRAQERVQTQFSVYKHKILEPFYTGEAGIASSYTIDSGEAFATYSAHQSAEERIMVAMAEEIAHDIVANLPNS